MLKTLCSKLCEGLSSTRVQQEYSAELSMRRILCHRRNSDTTAGHKINSLLKLPKTDTRCHTACTNTLIETILFFKTTLLHSKP